MNELTLSNFANRSSNLLQTIMLLVAMAILGGFVGFVLGGKTGLIIAVGLTLFGLFMGQQASAKIVLRMYKAQPLGPHQAPELFEMYRQLCVRAELSPHPGLYYIPSRMANAFAVGRGNSSAVAVTDGILRMMNPREIATILAHEITHVRCKDTTVLGFADIISRTISLISRVGLLMMLFGGLSGDDQSGFSWLWTGAILFFAPTVAVMLQLALSRTREFNADRGAAELTGDPLALASALKKLERGITGGFWKKVLRPGLRRKQPAILRTHPPTSDRVAALEEFWNEISTKQTSPVLTPTQRRIPASLPRVRRRPKYHIVSGIWK